MLFSNIKCFFTIIFCLCLSLGVLGQKSCDQQKLIDSASLMTFSIGLKKVVMSRDMSRIADYLQFPFLIKSCDLSNQEYGNKKKSLISRIEFIETKYNDFFGVWFMETVSKGYLYYILDSYDKDGRCSFLFSYPNTFISKKNNCTQAYFSVEKIQGQYKLTSSWESQ